MSESIEMCKIGNFYGFQRPNILARGMFLGDLHPMCVSNNSLNSDTGFMLDCSPRIYKVGSEIDCPIL